jgi:hypothetical protein
MTSFGAGTRSAILAIADAMIPASGELPAGGGEPLAAWLDDVAPRRPELVRDLDHVVSLVWEGDGGEALTALVASPDPATATFTDAVLEAYFTQPAVRSHYGWHGVQPAAAIEDEDELRALVAPQLAKQDSDKGRKWS